jgi:predicted transcriptional regulator
MINRSRYDVLRDFLGCLFYLDKDLNLVFTPKICSHIIYDANINSANMKRYTALCLEERYIAYDALERKYYITNRGIQRYNELVMVLR